MRICNHGAFQESAICLQCCEAPDKRTSVSSDKSDTFPFPTIPVGDTPPSAPDLLLKAADLMAARAKEYDQPGGERSMARAVAAFNALLGRAVFNEEAEGWLFMQVLKDVRLFTKPEYHADSAEDCIAYSALKAEAKARR